MLLVEFNINLLSIYNTSYNLLVVNCIISHPSRKEEKQLQKHKQVDGESNNIMGMEMKKSFKNKSLKKKKII